MIIVALRAGRRPSGGQRMAAYSANTSDRRLVYGFQSRRRTSGPVKRGVPAGMVYRIPSLYEEFVDAVLLGGSAGGQIAGFCAFPVTCAHVGFCPTSWVFCALMSED